MAKWNVIAIQTEINGQRMIEVVDENKCLIMPDPEWGKDCINCAFLRTGCEAYRRYRIGIFWQAVKDFKRLYRKLKKRISAGIFRLIRVIHPKMLLLRIAYHYFLKGKSDKKAYEKWQKVEAIIIQYNKHFKGVVK